MCRVEKYSSSMILSSEIKRGSIDINHKWQDYFQDGVLTSLKQDDQCMKIENKEAKVS
jgi:hypothetical protein